VENIYIILQLFNYETVYQISLESPEFYRRYYEKNILVFFWTHCRFVHYACAEPASRL